jgi:hypothetical protein
MMNKYLVRLKWMGLEKRFEIFNDAVEELNGLK